MTDLKELSGLDDSILSKLREMGVDDQEKLKGKIEELGADKLSVELGIDSATVESWLSDLSEEPEEEQPAGEEAEEEEAKEEKEEKEEKAAEGEEEKYIPKRKATVSKELSDALKLRKEIAERRPKFLRAEYFKAERLGMKWRKPRGKQGKMRLFAYYRPKSVSVGYGSPALARGLHPSGFAEKLIYNVKQLEGVDPKTTAVRIAHSVGSRKRDEIVEEAEKLEIRVLNG